MDWRKIVKLVLGIVITAAIIWGGYYLFQALVAAPPPTPLTTAPGTTALDLPAPQKLVALTKNEVFDYWMNTKTAAIYYLNPAGQVLKKTGDAEETANSQTLAKLNSVKAAPDGTYAVAKWNYPDFTTFSIFNTVTNAWQPLPDGTIAAAWSPNSQQLAYLENKNNVGRLKILNIVSGKTQTIAQIDQRDADLAWTNLSKILLFVSSPSADLASSLWSLDLKSKVLTPIAKDELGLVISWSKDGKQGLKLNNLDGITSLNLIDDTGNTLKTFSFITLPEKCALGTGKMYCGAPKYIQPGLVLPDDYYKKAVYFKDDIYAIDLVGDSVALLVNGDEGLVDAYHPSIQENQLLFINRYDNLLYSLQL